LNLLRETDVGSVMTVARDMIVPLFPACILGTKKVFVETLGEIVYEKGTDHYDEAVGMDFLGQIVQDSFSRAGTTEKSEYLEVAFSYWILPERDQGGELHPPF